jgi:putative glycosyltransferase (TIGR04348 family)
MSSKLLPRLVIVSPSLAAANTGNWHTAARWARMLHGHCGIGIASQWSGEPCAVLVALHARRSAASIDAFHRAHPERPLVVVLTGTDLYRDIAVDATAQRSLRQATHLVVLQDQGVPALPAELRGKTRVIYQSARRLTAVPAPATRLHAVSVGHLRDEKDPRTFMRAAQRLRARGDIRFTQIGGALDAVLGTEAAALQAVNPHYRWLGNLPRATTRQHVRRAQLLVNTSRMEGGAQVIVEAAQSGTAVLATRVPGNVGMLGADHAGLFELGDDAGLAQLIARARDEPGFLAALRRQTLARAPLFEPAQEQRHLLELITPLLETRR